MAAIALSNVAAKDITTITERGVLGEATAQGKSVYFNVSDQKWYKMDCSGNAVESGADGAGITLNEGQADDSVEILRDGPAIVEAALATGVTYVGGGTAAGDVNPNADADTNNWRKTVLFVAKTSAGVGSNTEIVFRPIVSETAVT